MSCGVGSKAWGSSPSGISVSTFSRSPATFWAMSAMKDSAASTVSVGAPAAVVAPAGGAVGAGAAAGWQAVNTPKSKMIVATNR